MRNSIQVGGVSITNPNNRENFSKYLRDISKLKPLSREEEQELFKQYKETNDPKIKEKICKHNLLFVVSIAKHYSSLIPYSTLTLEDLVNDGNIGLCIAIDKFDNESGNKFISYAVWWIRQQITESIQDNVKTIRLPASIKTVIRKIENRKERLEQLNSGEVTTEELFHSLEDEDLGTALTYNKIDELLKMNSFEISLNSKSVKHDEEIEILDLIKSDFKSPYEEIEAKERIDFLHSMMEKLPEYVQEYLTDYFGLNGHPQLTLTEMAEKHGRSSTGIKQTIDKYMRRMKANNRPMGKHLFPTPDYNFEKYWKSRNPEHENTIYLL